MRARNTRTSGRPGLRNAFPPVRPVASKSSLSVAAALLLFLSRQPFTIGNLHKRLTEARLNHTREREKNRRASEVFVRGGARVRVPGPGALEEVREKGREKRQISRREAAKKPAVEEEDDEATVEGQGRREGARRWRRKFTTRRPPELPTLPRRLRALFQVGFLASCAGFHPSPSFPLPTRQGTPT